MSLPMAHRISNAIEVASYKQQQLLRQRTEDERKARNQRYIAALPTVIAKLNQAVEEYITNLETAMHLATIEKTFFCIELPLGVGESGFKDMLNDRLAEHDYQMYVDSFLPETKHKMIPGTVTIGVTMPINRMPPG